MSTLARRGDLDPQRPLTTRLDDPVGGLEQHRQIAGQPVGVMLGQPPQAVARGLDFLVVVAHERHVTRRIRHRSGQVQQHRDARLHVGRPAPVQPVTVAPRRHVVDDRHRVEVAGQHDPPHPPEIGEGHHRIAVTDDAKVRQLA